MVEDLRRLYLPEVKKFNLRHEVQYSKSTGSYLKYDKRSFFLNHRHVISYGQNVDLSNKKRYGWVMIHELGHAKLAEEGYPPLGFSKEVLISLTKYPYLYHFLQRVHFLYNALEHRFLYEYMINYSFTKSFLQEISYYSRSKPLSFEDQRILDLKICDLTVKKFLANLKDSVHPKLQKKLKELTSPNKKVMFRIADQTMFCESINPCKVLESFDEILKIQFNEGMKDLSDEYKAFGEEIMNKLSLCVTTNEYSKIILAFQV